MSQSLEDKIVSYRALFPDSTPQDIADAFGLRRSQVIEALGRIRRRHEAMYGPGAELRAKLLPMLPGPGDRHEDCIHYDHCLTAPAKLNYEAHCPEECRQYQATSIEYHRAAASISRDSGTAVHLRTVGRGTW